MDKKTVYIVLAMLALALVVAGCSAYQAPANNQPSVPSQSQATVKTGSTSLGTIMTDAKGMSLYIFRKDTVDNSTCYGTCATFWPPLLVSEGAQPTGQGITATLGITQRTDGTDQVTANGLPLYYFVRDLAVGDVNGQGSNGSGALWYVLSPSGEQITTPLP